MNYLDVVDLSSDDETPEVLEDIKPTKEQLTHKTADVLENFSGPISSNKPQKNEIINTLGALIDVSEEFVQRKFCGNRLLTPVTSAYSKEPCRQFWKAGDYESRQDPGPIHQDGKNHLRVHPKFLHSNATSHKWVFGAVAELLDNAMDEINNGATFVTIDVLFGTQKGSEALLIQDDGGGMDPESLRKCMSFGFSEKSSSSIGQYGNGFKTSTMRLGADVIVFSRHMCNEGKLTQSVGLLSYTFLRRTSADDIVVPMVDYEVSVSCGSSQRLYRHSEKQFLSSLDAILRWSPFRSESDLLNQFDDIGFHGTKIVVFNLWLNDDGVLELDFDSEETDILISGAPKMLETSNIKKKLTQNHISNQLRFSLRVYLSILYLHVPEHFRIILRGHAVQRHKLAHDLQYVECIKYTPNVAGSKEAVFITTIGFLKGAPNLSVHGFSVYHKNRLILPFWRVVNLTYSKGRGVAGVLEANFIKPTHDKQDFEKSTLYFRLETRLKEMTMEYWDYHCHLVGYPNKNLNPTSQARLPIPSRQPVSSAGKSAHTGLAFQNGCALPGRPAATAFNCKSGQILTEKRRLDDQSSLTGSLKKQARVAGALSACAESVCRPQGGHEVRQNRKDVVFMMRENRGLLLECMDLEKAEKELNLKVEILKRELEGAKHEYDRLSTELRVLMH